MKTRVFVVLLCGFIGIAAGCGNRTEVSEQNISKEMVMESLVEEVRKAQEDVVVSENDEQTEKTGTETPSLGAWVAYWDMNTTKEELSTMSGKMDTICHFAAYFDSTHTPFIPEATTEYHKWQIENETTNDMETYLTFVNDIKLESGSSLKDTKLLYELFDTPESTKLHVERILAMTVQGGYDGIEIDYEAIRKDIDLWNLFLNFIEELVMQAETLDIKVRVLLEPNIPIEKLTFPKGPEYVMMCYNLHGYGTEAGPKADEHFLYEMVDIMEQLPGTINFALATGGFDFANDKSVAQVTMSQAQQLQKNATAEIKRDEDSKAVYFDYEDENGVGHQVWYADEKTLEFWMNVIRAEGHERFTIWRLGGNVNGAEK